MALDHRAHVHPRLLLQIIDVLRHAAPQHALILKHFDEVMRWRRIVLSEVEVLGEAIEGLRFVHEVVKGKDGFWGRQIVLLELRVEAGAG